MKINKSLFGEVEGNEIYRFVLMNAQGNSVSIINYGAAIISWQVTDHHNEIRDIVAGFANLKDYLENDVYMGCVVGRYANRIANGKLNINGTEYKLSTNNGVNHLHGGNKGFDKVIWDGVINGPENNKLSLTYTSKDGEEGYPGNLNVQVDYCYTDDDELVIEYVAATDKATPVNLTSHAYFNLTGNMDESILNHKLQINADCFTVLNETQIPTGEIKPVDNTPFDFLLLKSISTDFSKLAGGYDHNYVLEKEQGEFNFAALLTDPKESLQLSIHSTEPGLQFYSGNFLTGRFLNRDNKPLKKHAALCLETQHFPDSPNQPRFPLTILTPGKKYYSKTVYKIELFK